MAQSPPRPNVVLRSSHGEALGRVDHGWSFIPLFYRSHTVRADNAKVDAVFCASFVKFLAETSDARHAILMAQAGTTLCLENSDLEPTEDVLAEVRKRPFATFRRVSETKVPRRLFHRLARPISTAALWLVGFMNWIRS